MDAWLKSAVKLGAENLQQLVGGDGSRREVEFVHDGALGFELDGVRVAFVERDGQAAKLGVQVGDQVVAVDGYAVPAPSQRSEEAKRKAQEQVESWLRRMPRPGSVTFLLAEAAAERDSAEKDASGESATTAAATDAGRASEGGQGSDGARPEKATPGTPAPAGEAQNGASTVEVGCAGAALEEQLAALRAELNAERERVVALRGELYVAQEQGRSVESELQDARRECQELRHMAVDQDDGVGTAQSRMEVQMRTLQDQLARAREEADAAKKQAAEAQANAKRAEERCQQLQRVGAQAEEVFSDAFEGRERVLEEEVARLRALNSSSEMEHQKALSLAAERLEEVEARAREQLQASAARQESEVQDAEARASAAEAGAAVALRELRAEKEAHNASLQRLAAEHEQAVGRLQAQLEDALARAIVVESGASAAPEVGEAAPGKASGGGGKAKAWSPDSDSDEDAPPDVEAGAQPSPPVASPPPHGSPRNAPRPAAYTDDGGASLGASIEVMDLRERVQQLERRCCKLQEKLNQRPIVFQAPRLGKAEDPSSTRSGQGMWWEPRIRSALGPQQATTVIRLLTLPDRALKSFTTQLLKREVWLRFFYLHVVVLYAIAASYYAQTTQDLATSPLDSFSHGGVVQQHSASAQAGSAVAAVAAGGHG